MTAHSEFQLDKETVKELTSTKNKVSERLSLVDDLIAEFLKILPESDPDFFIKLNRLSILSKILEINYRYLENFQNNLDVKDPTIVATLSRCTFELHLVLLEACNSDAAFFKMLGKSKSAYEKYIEIFMEIAQSKGKQDAVNTFLLELQRFAVSTKKSEKLMAMNMQPTSLSGYYNFGKLAKKYGLDDAYKIEYLLISLFIHPSLLNIATTYSKDKTAPQKVAKVKIAVDHRQSLVRKFALYFIIGISNRTLLKIDQILEEYKIKN